MFCHPDHVGKRGSMWHLSSSAKFRSVTDPFKPLGRKSCTPQPPSSNACVAYIHTYILTSLHALMHACMPAHRDTDTYVHTYIHTYIPTYCSKSRPGRMLVQSFLDQRSGRNGKVTQHLGLDVQCKLCQLWKRPFLSTPDLQKVSRD